MSNPKPTGEWIVNAGPLAEFLLGEDTLKNRGKIYHWHARKLIHTFKIGNAICGRPEELTKPVEVSK